MQDDPGESGRVNGTESGETSGSTGEQSTFYRGVICKLFHGSMSGVVRSEMGRELPFFDNTVRILGQARRFEDLREGMPVGFDTSRTSAGLQVTVLWVEG